MGDITIQPIDVEYTQVGQNAEALNLHDIKQAQSNDIPISGGLMFQTYGHYGTTVFDPMTGEYLEIVVCDECIKQNRIYRK